MKPELKIIQFTNEELDSVTGGTGIPTTLINQDEPTIIINPDESTIVAPHGTDSISIIGTTEHNSITGFYF